jgi:hypothetical protein
MNKYLWAAIGLAATLLLAVSAVASPLTRLPSYQSDSHGVYIQFDNPAHNIDPTHGFPAAGGHMRWEWSTLEPFDDVYRFDSTVTAFILGEAEKGKKAAVGFETYVRRNTGSAPYGGVQAIPDWLRSEPVILWNTVDNLYYVTNFLDPTYKAQYADFVYDFADWLAAPANAAVLANLAWIEMGVGMESETQPADRWSDATKPDYDFYADYAPGGEDPPGWTSGDWLRFVNWCTDLYYDAFRVRNPSLASVAIYLNCAPEFNGKDYGSNRDAFSNYAATRGVADGKPGIGLKNNGLQADRSPAGLYGPLERWGSVVATTAVPIAWETYQSWLYDIDTLYWGLLCALDKHPDVIEPTRWLMVDGSYNPLADYVAVWNWVDPYVGVTPSTSPGIWCALRETETGGEYGNFFFWLYQNDSLSGGKTVALKPSVNPGDAWLASTGKEGQYGRRTDYASGNPYMHFQVLNPSPYYGNPSHETLTVTVTYLDKGTDQWKLRYDSTTGTKDAGVVVKTNTNTWKKATFALTDARFGNGYTDNGAGGGNGSAAADLTLDCMDSVDEYIHMVGITRRTEGGATPTQTATPTRTPTPTPTATPGLATLQGTVTLQGRPDPPAAAWVVALTVKIGDTNYAATTDSSGQFTISGLAPGTYDICVKNSHTLSARTTGVVLVAGTNVVNLGTLREGDANNNDFININDFSILASVFLTSDPQADFNQDGVVNLGDFVLLRDNYFVQGDCSSFASSSGGLLSTMTLGE